MLLYEHDLEPSSTWLLVNSNQFPWGMLSKNAIPYVQELGNFYASPGFYTQREWLPSYLLKYTISGEGVLEYQGNTYRVQPGECFWIDCQNYQKYYTSPDTGNWHVIWIHFYGDPCKQYYQLFQEYNEQKPVVRLPPGNNLSMMLSEMIETYSLGEVDPCEEIRASGMVTKIMVSCILAAANREDNLTPEYIRNVKSYIMTNYNKAVTLDEMSQMCNLNKYHFLRLFKRYTGSTPHEYLVMTRIHQSKTLLRSTDLPVAEISARVGIERVGHFIDLFKKSEGMTPGAFRRHWHG